VVELASLVPATANVLHYANLVRDAWVKRLVSRSLLEIGDNLETMSADEAVEALDRAALEIEESTAQKHERIIGIGDLVSAKRHAMENPPTVRAGVPTPFSFIPPLVGGRLYVLGGYMGDGKSAAALQFASEACEAGEKVGFASVEMSKSDLFDRWAVQRTGLDYWRVKNPHLLDMRQREVLDEALSVMESWKAEVIDDEFLDPGSLRRYQRTGKYDLLLVDHLHMMRWKDRHDLENNIKAITKISREFDVPIILLAQLSRAGDYAKPFPVPSMRQLRETAMLEAMASAVWFVYRERDEQHVQTPRSQFIVAKNRYGKVGTEALYFHDATQAFEENHWESMVVEEEPVGEKGLVDF